MSINPNRHLVAEFHRVFNIPVPAAPELPVLTDEEDATDLSTLQRKLSDVAAHAHFIAESADSDGTRTTFIRIQLMAEELGEVVEALSRKNLVDVAHELADLEYVVQGTVLSLGLDAVFEDCVAEIHAANMSKLDDNGRPIFNAAGRVVKGPHFRRANVQQIIANEQARALVGDPQLMLWYAWITKRFASMTVSIDGQHRIRWTDNKGNVREAPFDGTDAGLQRVVEAAQRAEAAGA